MVFDVKIRVCFLIPPLDDHSYCLYISRFILRLGLSTDSVIRAWQLTPCRETVMSHRLMVALCA